MQNQKGRFLFKISSRVHGTRMSFTGLCSLMPGCGSFCGEGARNYKMNKGSSWPKTSSPCRLRCSSTSHGLGMRRSCCSGGVPNGFGQGIAHPSLPWTGTQSYTVVPAGNPLPRRGSQPSSCKNRNSFQFDSLSNFRVAFQCT